MNFLSAIGQSFIQPVADQAIEAYYVLVGIEFLILVALILLVLQSFRVFG